ncbi:MAG: hypothetical protein HQM09_09955 [Candidatus Riflebacteria bacterium]|nr:hypothetical protein [Candidatus Riflebacteria bacterium]
MNCQDFRKNMIRDAETGVPKSLELLMEQHLDGCKACTEFVDRALADPPANFTSPFWETPPLPKEDIFPSDRLIRISSPDAFGKYPATSSCTTVDSSSVTKPLVISPVEFDLVSFIRGLLWPASFSHGISAAFTLVLILVMFGNMFHSDHSQHKVNIAHNDHQDYTFMLNDTSWPQLTFIENDNASFVENDFAIPQNWSFMDENTSSYTFIDEEEKS